MKCIDKVSNVFNVRRSLLVSNVFFVFFVFNVFNVFFVGEAFAQVEGVVEVENDFKPTVKDADKIKTLPDIRQTQASHYDVQYTKTQVPTLNYTFTPMNAATSDAPEANPQMGFVTGAYGTSGDVYARIAAAGHVASDDLLSAEFLIDGFNTDVDHSFLDDTQWKSRFYSWKGKINYSLALGSKSSALSPRLLFSLSNHTQVFNYWLPAVSSLATDKQHSDHTMFSATLTPWHMGRFAIGAGVNLAFFSQKYPTTLDSKLRETLFSLNICPSYSFSDSHKVDIALDWTSVSYNASALGSQQPLMVSPHYYYTSDLFSLKLGATMMCLDGETKFAPDVFASYHISPSVALFAAAEGGAVNQYLSDISLIHPYFTLADGCQTTPAWNQIGGRLGFTYASSLLPTVSVYAGYDKTESRLEITPAPSSLLPATYSLLPAIQQYDGTNFYISADIDLRYKSLLSLSLKNRWNKWDSDSELPITWRPIIDLDWRAKLSVMENLMIGVDCTFQTFADEEGYYHRENTFDLGADITYTFFKGLSAYVRGRNLLSQKQDRYMYYRDRGISGLVGVAYSF